MITYYPKKMAEALCNIIDWYRRDSEKQFAIKMVLFVALLIMISIYDICLISPNNIP